MWRNINVNPLTFPEPGIETNNKRPPPVICESGMGE